MESGAEMNTEEIKSVAALCYLEQAWTVIPRAEQAIALCEIFLARLAERAEPVGFSDCFGNLRNQRELDRLRDKGDARYKTYDIPLYTQPITKPAPQEGTTHPAELPARETPVDAAHLPKPAPQQQSTTSAINTVKDSDADAAAVGAAHDPFAPHIPLPLASTPSLLEEVQETLNDLRLCAKMGTNPIAQELTLRSYDMLERLATKHEVACDTIARQRADIDTIRRYMDELKKSCERLARNAAEWKHVAEDNMADYREYKMEIRTRAVIRNEITDEQLTTIYNTANGIGEGKAPPITTQRIFCAMRAMIAAGEKK